MEGTKGLSYCITGRLPRLEAIAWLLAIINMAGKPVY